MESETIYTVDIAVDTNYPGVDCPVPDPDEQWWINLGKFNIEADANVRRDEVLTILNASTLPMDDYLVARSKPYTAWLNVWAEEGEYALACLSDTELKALQDQNDIETWWYRLTNVLILAGIEFDGAMDE